MTDFTLDTSGFVRDGSDNIPRQHIWRWSDLSPFAQGYIEAMFASGGRTGWNWQAGGAPRYGFSDLAPKTLAAILRDCEAYIGRERGMQWKRNNIEQGAILWQHRAAGFIPSFPTLTPYLGDDAKVRLREPATAR